MSLSVYALTKYVVKDTGEEKTKFTRIGTAWRNRDDSLNVDLEASPISGRLQIRKDKPKEESETGGAR